MNSINTKKKFAVFGNPIIHSKSPIIHNFFSEQNNFNIVYKKILSYKESFYFDIINFLNNSGSGANITIPFKEKAYLICDKLTNRAKLTGSVNTIKKIKNNCILGDNTDGIGFITDLNSHNFIHQKKNLLLLGAGGAAKGIIPNLLKENFNVFILNRTFQKAFLLEKKFSYLGFIKAISFFEIKKNFFDYVVNATSLSLLGKIPNLPNFLINKNTICYDMFYSNEDTCFLKWCKRLGSLYTYDGIGMLIYQAAYSFFLWHNIFPNVKKVFLLLKNIEK